MLSFRGGGYIFYPVKSARVAEVWGWGLYLIDTGPDILRDDRVNLYIHITDPLQLHFEYCQGRHICSVDVF